MRAIAGSHKEIVQILVEHDTYGVHDESHQRAQAIAFRKGDTEIVQILEKSTGKVKTINTTEGLTPPLYFQQLFPTLPFWFPNK